MSATLFLDRPDGPSRPKGVLKDPNSPFKQSRRVFQLVPWGVTNPNPERSRQPEAYNQDPSIDGPSEHKPRVSDWTKPAHRV